MAASSHFQVMRTPLLARAKREYESDEDENPPTAKKCCKNLFVEVRAKRELEDEDKDVSPCLKKSRELSGKVGSLEKIIGYHRELSCLRPGEHNFSLVRRIDEFRAEYLKFADRSELPLERLEALYSRALAHHGLDRRLQDLSSSIVALASRGDLDGLIFLLNYEKNLSKDVVIEALSEATKNGHEECSAFLISQFNPESEDGLFDLLTETLAKTLKLV